MEGFAYHRPASLEAAAELLAELPEARPISGGQSLLPMMKQRLVLPEAIVDLGSIAELHGILVTGEKLVIGALERHYDVSVSPIVAQHIPMLSVLAAGIGDVQVRHRGTIGGSVANNDPAADYPAACLALGAEIITNQRRIPAEAFFRDVFETCLVEGEIVVAVEFPLPRRAIYSKYRHMISRYALVGVCLAETVNRHANLTPSRRPKMTPLERTGSWPDAV